MSQGIKTFPLCVDKQCRIEELKDDVKQLKRARDTREVTEARSGHRGNELSVIDAPSSKRGKIRKRLTKK